MKRIILLFLLSIWLGGCMQKQSESKNENITFIVASDMGRRGESEQQNIADLLGCFAEKNNVDFVAVAGDPIHDDGVMSVIDEEWNLKFENIYTAESLQKLPFYVASGNHEYRGSIQAILDYSNISERWNAPARYFTIEKPIGKSNQKALFVFIDTAPLIDKYRVSDEYSDAGSQNMERQLHWLDSILAVSGDKWKIVVGHHPVYACTEKEESERTDMQKRVGRILENRKADFYICGHIHNFQHIKPEGSKVNYIVNSSASQSRDVYPIEGTIFCNPDPGYSVFTVTADSVQFLFINHTADTVYRQTIIKNI